MRKCHHEFNLKSTAYNPTGQRCVEQFAAYNSMSSHLRRILFAKSRVDTRNETYISRTKRLCRATLDVKSVNDILDELDLGHLSVHKKKSYSQKHCMCCGKCCYIYNLKYTGRTVPDKDRLTSRDICITEKSRSRLTIATDKLSKKKDSYENSICDKKSEQEHSEERSSSSSQEQKVDNQDNVSHSSKEYDEDDDVCTQHSKTAVDCDMQKPELKDSENKYTKFMYDITEEIIKRNLYTNEELHEVFKKHLEQNRNILDMNEMLYKIYHLKISLNIMDNLDINDEIENFANTQNTSTKTENESTAVTTEPSYSYQATDNQIKTDISVEESITEEKTVEVDSKSRSMSTN